MLRYQKGFKMPSFDIVSKIDIQEVKNAITNTMKEIGQRYDFKGSISKVEFNGDIVLLEAEDEMKAKQVHDLLIGHFVKRKVDPKAIGLLGTEKASGNTVRQTYELRQGIDQKLSKKIIAEVKTLKLKVQVKIIGDELRTSGNKRDDLQKVMESIKSLNLDLPIQFKNLRD